MPMIPRPDYMSPLEWIEWHKWNILIRTWLTKLDSNKHGLPHPRPRVNRKLIFNSTTSTSSPLLINIVFICIVPLKHHHHQYIQHRCRRKKVSKVNPFLALFLTSEFKTKNAKYHPFPGRCSNWNFHQKKTWTKNWHLPTQNLGHAAMWHSQLTRDDARANAHCRHFNNFVANVIRQGATIDEDAAELIDATLAGINETLKEETVYMRWVVDYYYYYETVERWKEVGKKETTYSG